MRTPFTNHTLSRPLLVIVLLLLSAPVSGNDTDLLMYRALTSSGTSAQLQQLCPGILSAVPEDAFPDKKSHTAAAAILREDATRNGVVSAVHAALRESLDRAVLEKVAGFFDSKVGKKVGRAQQGALETAMLKRVREGRSLVVTLSDTRMALLERITRAQQVSERNGRFLNAVIRGLVDGSLTGNAVQADEIKSKVLLIEKEIQAGRPSTEETALISSAYLFRSLDDKELEEYLAFEESEPAARFRNALQSGLEQAIYQCAKALGEYSCKARPAPQNRSSRDREERPSHRDSDGDDSASGDITIR